MRARRVLALSDSLRRFKRIFSLPRSSQVDTAHRATGLGGGHVALLGGFVAATDDALIVEPNPAKYLPCWRCPLVDLFDALCVVDTSKHVGRAHGLVRLRHEDLEAMALGRSELAMM